MNSYSITYKKVGFFKFKKVFKDVIGHHYSKDQDKMVVYFANGSLREVGCWSKHQIFLGTDWVMFTKNNMDKEAQADVKLKVNTQMKSS